MSASDWQRVQDLFRQALEKPEEQRSAFLDSACGGDPRLRADVESLLDHDSQAGEDFMSPPKPADVLSPATETLESSSRRVSREPFPEIEGYEILRELQSGGQGVVYQALQTGTKHKVAIKVLRDGPNASEKTRRRFEREIELAASLRHPNIVSILHSGRTATGQQFCVMDYVRGKTLTDYAKTSRLSLEQSLRLFASVCDAVNHAHQKGIIHRDLKPNNILVDGSGEPHVVDFGLAKTVGGPDQSLISLTGQVVGTLAYMSPEQTRGNPDEIDTRTDVYALGVILYELLTGHFPYPVAEELAKVLEHIVRTQPTPPSRVWTPDSGIVQRSGKRLRMGHCPIDNEVETIILRSLAKERERRYQSASAIAADVRHYLANEPIDAKRDSGWYLVKKFVLRRRITLSVTSATIIAVVLVASLVMNVLNTKPYNASVASMYGTDNLPKVADPQREEEYSKDIKFLVFGGFRPAAVALAKRYRDADEANAARSALLGWASLELFEELSGAAVRPADPVELARLRDAAFDVFPATTDAYGTSARLDPAYRSIAFQGIGHAYFLRGKYFNETDAIHRAIAEYSRALDLDPAYPLALSNRGHAYFELGAYEEAARDYADATKVGPEELQQFVPDAWRTYRNYGTTLRILGRPNEAAKAYKTSTELPGGQKAYTEFAFALAIVDSGDAKTMLVELERAAEMGGSNSWTNEIAQCLSGEIDPADLPTLAENDTQACEAPYYAGERCLLDGDRDAATIHFQTCVDTCAKTNRQSFNEARFARWRLGLENTSRGNLNEGEFQP